MYGDRPDQVLACVALVTLTAGVVLRVEGLTSSAFEATDVALLCSLLRLFRISRGQR